MLTYFPLLVFSAGVLPLKFFLPVEVPEDGEPAGQFFVQQLAATDVRHSPQGMIHNSL